MSAVPSALVAGVIASSQELRLAARMRTPPDLFELRLDHLPQLKPESISQLPRPIIITARHPAEGGKPTSVSRRDLLLKFLPQAEFLDLELRSLAQLRDVWDQTAHLKIQRICSVHNFACTPPRAALRKQLHRARKAGADIFKLVTRADTPDDLLTLLAFLRDARRPCCVMATGKFGPISRLLFPQCGSQLVYAPLRGTLHDGQLTLEQLRRLRDFYPRN